MRRVVSVSLLIIAMLVPAATSLAGWSKPKTLVVRGQVTDSVGRGVEGVPVRVLATRRVVKFLTIESKPAEAEIVSTLSGPDGFYEVSVPKLRDYDFYFLRFYSSDDFDSVRFAVPSDIEITSWISKRRPAVQDMMLQPAAGWDAVQRLVDLYGAETPRGRIVRQLGVPERTERLPAAGVSDREIWWYDTVGVAYVIEGGRVMETKTFQPSSETLPLARQ